VDHRNGDYRVTDALARPIVDSRGMNMLLAYDGSEGARRALEVVLALAREGDRVTVAGVAEGIPLYGYVSALPSEADEEQRQRQLEEAGPRSWSTVSRPQSCGGVATLRLPSWTKPTSRAPT